MKKYILRVILLIIILLISSVIFGFSSQDGEKSGGLSKKVVLIIADIFNIENENSLYLYIDASSDSSVELNITGQDYVRNLSFNNNTMINIGNRKVGESIKVEIIPERRYIN